MSLDFLGGKQVMKSAIARNRGQACLHEELFILKTIINAKLWVEISIFNFLIGCDSNRRCPHSDE